MNHPVAPGKDGYNLLSKRHSFRVVLVKGLLQRAEDALKGPLVLEAEDGSYTFEYPFKEAVQEDGHLVFEFHLRHRDKKYKCYIKDGPRQITWAVIPKQQIGIEDISEQGSPNS